MTGLPEIVKENSIYSSIFGKNRDLEVYPEPDGSLRTRSSFEEFLPNETDTNVFFEFKIFKDRSLIIRKILKKRGSDEEHKYVLAT